jgi:hypothetical protein
MLCLGTKALLMVTYYYCSFLFIPICRLDYHVTIEKHEPYCLCNLILLLFISTESSLSFHFLGGIAVRIDFIHKPFSQAHQKLILLQIVFIFILGVIGLYLNVLFFHYFFDLLLLFSHDFLIDLCGLELFNKPRIYILLLVRQ